MSGIQGNVNLILKRKQHEYGEVLWSIFSELRRVWAYSRYYFIFYYRMEKWVFLFPVPRWGPCNSERWNDTPNLLGFQLRSACLKPVFLLFHDASSVHSAPMILNASDFCFPTRDADFKPWTSIVFISDQSTCTVTCRLHRLLSEYNKTPVARMQWLFTC